VSASGGDDFVFFGAYQVGMAGSPAIAAAMGAFVDSMHQSAQLICLTPKAPEVRIGYASARCRG
jgi:hypothetical protein